MLPLLSLQTNGSICKPFVGNLIGNISSFFFVICLITGWNTIDEVWTTARQIVLLIILPRSVVMKVEFRPGRDVLRLLQIFLASSHFLWPWALAFDPSKIIYNLIKIVLSIRLKTSYQLWKQIFSGHKLWYLKVKKLSASCLVLNRLLRFTQSCKT